MALEPRVIIHEKDDFQRYGARNPIGAYVSFWDRTVVELLTKDLNSPKLDQVVIAINRGEAQETLIGRAVCWHCRQDHWALVGAGDLDDQARVYGVLNNLHLKLNAQDYQPGRDEKLDDLKSVYQAIRNTYYKPDFKDLIEQLISRKVVVL